MCRVGFLHLLTTDSYMRRAGFQGTFLSSYRKVLLKNYSLKMQYPPHGV